MNLFALSGLLTGIACTVMAGLVYFTNRASRVNRLWAILCLAVSLWGFEALLIGLTSDPQLALTWWRLAHVPVIFIPVLFYHFITVFTGLRRSTVLALAYVVSAGFLLADATPDFITHVRQLSGGLYYHASPSITYAAFVLFFLGMAFLSHLELWRHLRRTKERAQRLLVRWFMVGTAIGFAGGATCFLPTFGIDLYPYGNFAVPLFPLIMTYAFLRYRLTDRNLTVVRGVTFLALYSFVVGVPFFVGHRYQALWRTVLGDWWWVAPVVLMGLLASASPVLFLFFVRRLEQKLWQAQRRYHRTLMAASSGMTRIKDIERLCRLIVYTVNHTVRLANTSLFLYEPAEQGYVLRAVRYRSLIPLGQTVAETDPLIGLLREKKDLVMVEELGAELEGARPSDKRTQQAASVYAWMRKFETQLIVPSFSNDQLLAFLALGAKHTGEPYTTDDIALFSALANQAALAIENALFFEELHTNEAYMIQSEKLASLGQLASGMAHEIHNPLTIISGEAQLYLERFKGQDPKVDEVLTSIIEECQRAADITRRILRFAKPAPSDVAPINLKTTIDETMTLASYQVRMDRFECAVTIAGDLPKVRGNQNQLQEVFLNLILNACQAMGDRGGKLLISAGAENSQLVVKVEDTGPGIPANTLRKVFDPFFTTKSSGTGLGLFVSQRIVKAHGGTIELESEEGKGTRFTIRLPAWREDDVVTPSGTAP